MTWRVKITKADAEYVGLKLYDLNWVDKIKPILMSKGVPEEWLHPCSFKCLPVFSGDGARWLMDDDGSFFFDVDDLP